MSERRLQDLSASERSADFRRIFDMLPNDLPGLYYSTIEEESVKSLKNRRDSELREVLARRLSGLLESSNLTKSGRAFFKSAFDVHYVYGLRQDHSSILLKSIIDSIETPEGIFGEEAWEVDNAAFWAHDFEIFAMQSDLDRGLIQPEEVGDEIIKGKTLHQLWREEFRDKFGREPANPKVE